MELPYQDAWRWSATGGFQLWSGMLWALSCGITPPGRQRLLRSGPSCDGSAHHAKAAARSCWPPLCFKILWVGPVWCFSMGMCVQGSTTSCRATLAATVDVGSVGEEEEEASEDECETPCNAAPYPQLPAGYDQSAFYVELGKRDPSAIDAQRRACVGSDAAAEPMKALLTVQTVRPAASHHMASLQ